MPIFFSPRVAFNPSFTYDVPMKPGKLVPGMGWISGEYIGIDQARSLQ